MSAADLAAMGSAFMGAVVSLPALIGLPMLFAKRRGQRRKKRSEEAKEDSQLGRFLVGLGLVATSLFLVMGRVAASDGIASVVALFFLGFASVGRIISYFSAAPIEASTPIAAPEPAVEVDAAILELRERDPGFSRVSLLDWTQALYHGAHGLLGTPGEKDLYPFVDRKIFEALHQENPSGTRLTQIVIGAMTIEEITLGGDRDGIVIDLEANYTAERAGQEPNRLVQHERWQLARAATAQTPPPARMRVLSCPSCGAALSVSDLGACTYCSSQLRGGQLQWVARRRVVVSTEIFSTDGLGETVTEEGTQLPTIFDPNLREATAELASLHGLPDAAAFGTQLRDEVVAPVFKQMYAAWSSRHWNEVRHLLTDRLWESQRAWVDAYIAKGLTNRLADLRINKIEIVRAERDRDYEAATVRIFASCCDYTVDKSGETIGGDAKRPRRFSEYWVFIRAANAKPPAAARAAAQCPNCGAALDKLGATGVCGYCNAKVTTGDFGWVLSAIVQDESYRG